MGAFVLPLEKAKIHVHDVMRFSCARHGHKGPHAKEGEILPILDRWAKLIPQVRN